MEFVAFASDKIRKAGHRETKSRLLVLQILAAASKALNPYEIEKLAREEGKKIDVVTVYRILDLLKDLKLVHESGAGYLACKNFECLKSDHCHHLFVCEKCEKSYEFHIEDQKFIEEMSKKLAGFVVSSHKFELGGLCLSCNN